MANHFGPMRKPKKGARVGETLNENKARELLEKSKFFFCHKDFIKTMRENPKPFRHAWRFMHSIPDDWTKKINVYSWSHYRIPVMDSELSGGHISAQFYPYSKSHRMTYTLNVGKNIYFIKETSCGKSVGRWAPFEMAALLDLRKISTPQIKIVRPLAAISDGKSSFLVMDFLQSPPFAYLKGLFGSSYYRFVDEAVKMRYWELGDDNFFYDQEKNRIRVFDPYSNMSNCKNIDNLLRIAEEKKKYFLKTNFPL